MGLFKSVVDELGLSILFGAPRDAFLLMIQRFTRMIAYGQSTLVLASYLHALEISDFKIGLFMTLTLVGDVTASLFLTFFADRIGRRKVLSLGCGLMILSGVVFALSGNYFVLLLAAIVGVISPSGNEIGPFRAIEESTLASLIQKEQRSTIYAWTGLLTAFAGALGSLTAGFATQYLQTKAGWSEVKSFRAVFVMYAGLGFIKLLFTLCLSERCELAAEQKPPAVTPQENGANVSTDERTPLLDPAEASGNPPAAPKPAKPAKIGLTPETRSKLKVLSLLFGLDNLASGLVPLSFIIYYFSTRFSLDESTLGTTVFTTSVIAACSNLVSASLSRRIGNIKTMAFTHLPSSIFLALIPLPSKFELARAFLILRFCTAQMDGAPRSAFLANYIPDRERTSVMGIINVVKTFTQSLGPSLTGYLSEKGLFRFSFFAAGAMKAAYDLMILYFFSKATMAG